MSIEQSKALVRRIFEEAFNQEKLSALDEIFSPDFADLSTPEQSIGPDGVRLYFKMVRTGFPNMTITIEEIVAEGDKVVVRTTWRGTHQGGYEGIASTGEQVVRSMIHIFRIEDDRVLEEWAEGQSLEQCILHTT